MYRLGSSLGEPSVLQVSPASHCHPSLKRGAPGGTIASQPPVLPMMYTRGMDASSFVHPIPSHRWHHPWNPSRIFHTSVPPATTTPATAAASSAPTGPGGAPPHRLPCSSSTSRDAGSASSSTLALHGGGGRRWEF